MHTSIRRKGYANRAKSLQIAGWGGERLNNRSLKLYIEQINDYHLVHII